MRVTNEQINDAVTKLAKLLEEPIATIQRDGKYFFMIEQADGAYTPLSNVGFEKRHMLDVINAMSAALYMYKVQRSQNA